MKMADPDVENATRCCFTAKLKQRGKHNQTIFVSADNNRSL